MFVEVEIAVEIVWMVSAVVVVHCSMMTMFPSSLFAVLLLLVSCCLLCLMIVLLVVLLVSLVVGVVVVELFVSGRGLGNSPG